MQESIENHGPNCYIPTSGHCFRKCINYFTTKDYTEEFLTFIQPETYRSGVMTSARIQPFCRNYIFNIGCFDGTRIKPGNITERNTSLFKHRNHFCVIWTPNVIRFNQAIENELKPKVKVVDNVISDKHVKKFMFIN